MKYCLVAILIIFASTHSLAITKPYLYLTKVNRQFELKFHIDSPIRMKMKGHDQYIYGKIQAFTDSSIFIHETEFIIKNIAEVDTRGLNYGFWSIREGAGNIIVAGALFPLVELANRGTVSPSVLITSGILAFTGTVMQLSTRKGFRPGGRNKIAIIY